MRPSLQEEVRQRRAAETATESAAGQVPGPALVVRPWKGECWVLPWAQFVAARVDPEEGGRRLEIVFASYRVIASGENLMGLLDDIAMQRVTNLRELPDSYRARAAEGTPFIANIEVQPVTIPSDVSRSP